MILLLRKGRKEKYGKYTLFILKDNIHPFSIGQFIAMSGNDYHSNFDTILTHEKRHAEKRHSLDLLFAEAVIILQWFNPAAWLLKRELHNSHEYEADRGVIQSGIDATQYQLLVIKEAVGAKSYAIANSFNQCNIKNRIKMMTKRKSTQWARFKLLLFAPLAVTLLLSFARPETVRTDESLINSDGTTNSQQSQQWTKDYFDGKVDEYVQKVNGNTKDCGKWFMIDLKLNDDNWIWQFRIKNPPPAQSAKVKFTPPLVSKKFSKTDAGKKDMLDHMVNCLKKNEEERSKKNLHSPSIVYLHFENVSDSEMQPVLDALGNLNEEFTKAREEQKQKAWEKDKNINFTTMYSSVPVFVAINANG